MSTLVMLLLALSGCVTSYDIYREYHLINKARSCAEAQTYCRVDHTDLASIGNQEDMNRLVNMAKASGLTGEIWIGLKRTGPQSWQWSVGETWMSHGLVDYTNWASFPDSSHYCGGMRGDGKWLSVSCTMTLYFVCQEAKGSNEMHVVLQTKTWSQAQEHCRLNHMDLASVKNRIENQALQQIMNKNGQSLSLVWIGLFKDDWKWLDQSDSSFRSWTPGQPNNDGACAVYHTSSLKWYDRDCAVTLPFFCYNAKKKTVQRILKVEVKLNSLFNLNDNAASEAILKQIQTKYEGAKLRWRVQPDGKIFHKKEKKVSVS